MFLEQAAPEIQPTDVLAALSNEHDRQILALAQPEPVAAQRILEETGIAKSTLYRRLRQLEDSGLLTVEHTSLQEGQMVDRFRSRLSSVSMRIQEGRIETRVEPLDEDAEPEPSNWRRFDPREDAAFPATTGPA